MLSHKDNETLTRVGPGTAMGNFFRRFWLPVMLQSELPKADGEPVKLRVLGEDLIAFRDSDGRVGILDELCPHRRASLFFGRNEECGLRCVYHGWKFDVDGNCVDMPSEPPDSDFKRKVRATSYPASEHGGLIWAYMGPPEDQPVLPQLEWAGVPEGHRFQRKWHIDANFMQGLEGEIDTAHTAFLHRHFETDGLSITTTKGQEMWQADASPQITVEPTPYGFRYGSRRDLGDGTYNWRITQWMMPTFTLIPSRTEWPVSCRAYIPIDDEHTMVIHTRFDPTAPLTESERIVLEEGRGGAPRVIPDTFTPENNAANGYLLDREAQRTVSFTGINGVNNQDRAVVESMRPIVDRSREHLGTSDKAIIAARQILLDAARQLEAGTPPPAVTDAGLYAVRSLDIVAPMEELSAVVAEHGDALNAEPATV